MFRRSLLSNAVREFGHVFFRTQLKTLQQKAAQTPLLQERPYPLAEIVRRIVRVRIKYQETDDEQERALLRGEYKFYTGKGVHLRDAQTADLVAMISCAAFFGFFDTALVDRVLGQVLSRAEELSSLELCQLAQDLPRVGKPRSPHMRAIFRLLCSNDCASLRTLELEDHMDLVENAVGVHCPYVFVHTLIFSLIAPHVLQADRTPSLSLQNYVSILEALVVREQVKPLSWRRRKSGHISDDGTMETENKQLEEEEKQQRQLVKRVRLHLLEACKEESPDLTADMVAQIFELLATLNELDIFSARTLRQWFDKNRANRLTEPVAAIALCLRQAQLFGVAFSLSPLSSSSSSSSSSPGGGGGSRSDFYRLFSLLAPTIVENSIPALEIADLPMLFDLLAIVCSSGEVQMLGAAQKRGNLADDGATTTIVLESVLAAALQQVELLTAAGGTIWPSATLLRLLSAAVHIAKASSPSSPPILLNRVVKNLCSPIVALAPEALSCSECCAFLAIASEMPSNLILDAAVSAVARRLAHSVQESTRAAAAVAAESDEERQRDAGELRALSPSEVADLLTVLKAASSLRQNNVIHAQLMPALAEYKV